MDVYVGNLHEKVTEADLMAFFAGFARHAMISLSTRHYHDGSQYRFGLARFSSERHALKAIKKLQNKPLLGLPVVVREYFYRSSNNERRALNWRMRPWEKNERRGTDRRRKEVPAPKGADKAGVRVSGYGQFARKSI